MVRDSLQSTDEGGAQQVEEVDENKISYMIHPQVDRESFPFYNTALWISTLTLCSLSSLRSLVFHWLDNRYLYCCFGSSFGVCFLSILWISTVPFFLLKIVTA